MKIPKFMRSPRLFLKNLMSRNKNLFIFSEDIEQEILNQVLSYAKKEDRVLWIKDNAEQILYKSSNERVFYDITGEENRILAIRHNQQVDIMVLDRLGKEDFFSMLSAIYNDKIALIAVFENTTVKEFEEFLDNEVNDLIKDQYPYLTRNYFLSKTLPVVLEGNKEMKTLSELTIKADDQIKREEIFAKNEKWGWTGYYPTYFLKKRVDLQELESLDCFKRDKELHQKLENSVYSKLKGVAESYYVPIATEESQTGTLSYYGGLPLIPKGEKHPTCDCCNEELSLMLQIDLKSAPVFVQEKIGSSTGYFQVFCCENEESECFMNLGEQDKVRIIEEDRELVLSPAYSREMTEKKEIVQWVEKFIKPSPKFLKENGVSLDKEEKAFLKWLYEEANGVTDQIGGKPVYNQDNPRLKCKESKKPLKFILQIEADFNLENFNGRTYVYQSPVEKTKFTSYWDCD